MSACFVFTAAGMGLLMLVVSFRLFLGPTVPDRVVALDAINTLVVASMILLAAVFGETMLVDVAIVYALLSYVGTLYIARSMKRKG